MEISAETERSCGNGRGVSNVPIRLRVYSPKVLTMTLVDLPGLARVPVGDQPADIEDRIRSMIIEYISAPSCIILAVTPANQDLAASDALDLAKQVDPDGMRTLGVLTKLDIMDRGTDGAAVLRNEVVSLRLGYIGVVLRSQQDIDNRVGVSESRARERMFFESHPEYNNASSLVARRCGVGRLAQAINQILVEHVRAALPTLKGRLEGALVGRQRELATLGDSPPGSTGAARGALLLTLLDAYATRFIAMLDGKGDCLPINELAGGARIRHIFQEVFNLGLDCLDPCAELSDEDVRTAIKNSGGIKGSLLIPEAPFEVLVKKAIERLQSPSLQCKEFVHTELLRIAAHCAPPEIARFPVLQTVLAEAVEEFIGAGAGPAEDMIRNLVSCELAYINTSHPLFIGGNRAISEVLERRAHEKAAGTGGGGSTHGRGFGSRMTAGGNVSSTTHNNNNNNSSSSRSNRYTTVTNGVGRVDSSGLALSALNISKVQDSQQTIRGGGSFSMGLKEPELFRSDDLLSGVNNGNNNDRMSNGGGGMMPSDQEDAAARGWFTHWFNAGGNRQPDGITNGTTGGEGGNNNNNNNVFGDNTNGLLLSSSKHHHQQQHNNHNQNLKSYSLGLRDIEDAPLQGPPEVLKVPKSVSDQEAVQVEVTRVLVSSYFDIVRKNLQDAVPKALMHFLVNGVSRGLQQHLIRTLYREELFSELMGEREDIASRRAACREMLKALKEGLSTLESLPVELLEKVQMHIGGVDDCMHMGGGGGGGGGGGMKLNGSAVSMRSMLQASLDDKWQNLLVWEEPGLGSPQQHQVMMTGSVAVSSGGKQQQQQGSRLYTTSTTPLEMGLNGRKLERIPALHGSSHSPGVTLSPPSNGGGGHQNVNHLRF
jgi:dynamin 1-like protein